MNAIYTLNEPIILDYMLFCYALLCIFLVDVCFYYYIILYYIIYYYIILCFRCQGRCMNLHLTDENLTFFHSLKDMAYLFRFIVLAFPGYLLHFVINVSCLTHHSMSCKRLRD